MVQSYSVLNPLKSPEASLQGGVLALGNFDGVHRGHRAVLQTALEQADRLKVPARVLTLEPHPRSLLTDSHTPFRLTPASVKNRLLQNLGIADVITLNFSPELANQPARDFVEQILVERYRPKQVVVGAYFVFGHKRAGTLEHMRQWLEPHSIGVTEVQPFRDDRGELISSSRIRTALHKADLKLVGELLGRPWSITGIVVTGAKRGRVLGFPTANVEIGDYVRPPFGVYAVRAHKVGDAKVFDGVANIGTRPTVGGMREMLEFYLFQNPGVLYDQEWEVELHQFLRPEQAFESLEALKEQIGADVVQAKEFFGNPS